MEKLAENKKSIVCCMRLASFSHIVVGVQAGFVDRARNVSGVFFTADRHTGSRASQPNGVEAHLEVEWELTFEQKQHDFSIDDP